MSAAAPDAIRSLLEPLLPPPAWAPMQFGEWRDPGGRVRSAVLRPVGGAPAELVRRPTFTLSLVGLDGGDATEIGEAADAIVERVRVSAGSLVGLTAGEPVFVPTADRRPMFEIALSAIAT